MRSETIAILGAGSWGTAVAIHLAQVGHRVLLWGHNPQQVIRMAEQGCNTRYLPGINFPPTLIPTNNLAQCLREAQQHIIAVPKYAIERNEAIDDEKTMLADRLYLAPKAEYDFETGLIRNQLKPKEQKKYNESL